MEGFEEGSFVVSNVKPGTKFRHKKTGGVYTLESYATIEATMTQAIVYRHFKTGKVWVRSEKEFFDGRFEYFPKMK